VSDGDAAHGDEQPPLDAVAAARLAAYLSPPNAVRAPVGGRVKRAVKLVVPRRMRSSVALIATDAVSPLARRRARTLLARAPVRLHLGSASTVKDGWVDIDVVGHPVDVAWNLLRRLPFPDRSVDAVFHEHVLEHFSLEHGLRLTEECARVLKPGGVLRIAVPDTAAYARSYIEGNGIIDEVRPGRPTRLLAFQEIFFRHGHRTMYDFETLALVLTAAGFAEIEQQQHGQGRLQPSPDSPQRADESLYVEAVRP
jgi:predicted SAM-dependent methyltransferase